ncbi:MAG TPA: aspartate aminotransferase family protein [Spirochaetaceae bacterium]|nr:aspartate aminotransferase family protein [Spirochaetaceae bacterium]
MTITEKDKKYVANTYSRFPVEIVSGKGSIVRDSNGKEYIDLTSGIGVTSFGVADDVWQNAIQEQISRIQHISNLYYTQPCAELAELLCAKTGMGKVFFSNSGAEANECAIKVARKYAQDRKGGEYFNIVTLNNSFHGRTLTTLAATGQDVFHKLFNPLTPGFLQADANDVAGLERILKENKCAGVMIECVQGEGGVIALDADYVKKVRELCDKYDCLMITDEVQCGNGRTGRLYAYMNFGIRPDVVSTAKGLAGGLPLGATLMAEKCAEVLGSGDHGSTFGGNPVCCAAAISVLKRIDDALLEDVRKKSECVFSELGRAKGVESITGMGLMIGIKTEKDASQVIGKCIENGVLCLKAKDKVRLLPALNIPFDVLKKAIGVIKSAIV